MKFWGLALFSVLAWLVTAPAANACRCQVTFSACHEAAQSDLVFTGTVESIDPPFLSRWNLSSQSSIKSLNEAYLNAQAHPSAEAVNHLKSVYLQLFPKTRLLGEESISGVASLFGSATDRGMRVRFRVRSLFKRGDDDNQDDDDTPDHYDIWTPFGDCGYDFQTGETYLVYASNEEDSDYYFTTSCNRTQRLSDAGNDLSYLLFYKNEDGNSRLEGFVTNDPRQQFAFDSMHDTESIAGPMEGLTVQLHSGGFTRYALADTRGRFVFDGLPKGDYAISVYPGEFPFQNQLLAGPQTVHVDQTSCARQVLIVPVKN